MGTRYTVDETGERVSVIIDVADYERMIEAQSKVVEAARVLQQAVRMMSGSGSSGTGYAGYRRALKALEDNPEGLIWGNEEARNSRGCGGNHQDSRGRHGKARARRG